MKHHQYVVFEAYTNSDTTEGRGRKVHLGFFFNREDAEKAAKGQGVMGCDADVIETTAELTVYDSYEEYLGANDEAEKQEALESLTPRQRRLLKLPEPGKKKAGKKKGLEW